MLILLQRTEETQGFVFQSLRGKALSDFQVFDLFCQLLFVLLIFFRKLGEGCAGYLQENEHHR